ncbi:MAG: MCP methyltransferase, CheR-type [Osedax symbiont Rs1]|nr:MAG: MCP methyltransferase, CheR-type [Osedax symbiont Rs1]
MEPLLNLGREFDFTDKQFAKVKSDLYDYAGIVLADHKKSMAYNRLVRRLRALNLQSFDSYFNFIAANPVEINQFINALTTNLSSFFREKHHFDFIVSTIIPRIRASAQQRIRIWSAGCSNGEEAYSIAMSLTESLLSIDRYDIKILATDINSSVLETAQRGLYDIDRIKLLEPHLVRKYFIKGRGNYHGKVQIRPELQQMIHFKYLNLISEWPMQGQFDFIFCRNVMIYFNRQTQRQLILNLARYIQPEGYLFVGHSEALAHQQSDFKLIGKTIYQHQATL